MLEYRKQVLRAYERKYPQIRILVGGEIDVWPNGALTLPSGIEPDHFDYLLVAHHHTLPKEMLFLFKRKPEIWRWLWHHSPYLHLNKRLWKLANRSCFNRYAVDIWAHPQEGMPWFMADEEYKEFVLLLKKHNIALELNQFPTIRPHPLPRYVKKYHRHLEPLLEYGKKYHLKFSIASDFHGFKREWEKYDLAECLDDMYKLVEAWGLELLDPTQFFPENREQVTAASSGKP